LVVRDRNQAGSCTALPSGSNLRFTTTTVTLRLPVVVVEPVVVVNQITIYSWRDCLAQCTFARPQGLTISFIQTNQKIPYCLSSKFERRRLTMAVVTGTASSRPTAAARSAEFPSSPKEASTDGDFRRSASATATGAVTRGSIPDHASTGGAGGIECVCTLLEGLACVLDGLAGLSDL